MKRSVEITTKKVARGVSLVGGVVILLLANTYMLFTPFLDAVASTDCYVAGFVKPLAIANVAGYK